MRAPVLWGLIATASDMADNGTMKAILPSGVDPTLGNSANPLVEHVVSIAPHAPYRGVDVEDMGHVCRGILAFASSRPFDPNQTACVVKANSYEKQPVQWEASPLDAVLFLGGHSGEGEPLPRIRWPTHMEGFSASLLEHSSRKLDIEWVAACLLVAGADPWRGWKKDSGQLPFCVSQAIRLGYAGLFERMMQCPGAPGWEAVGDMAPVGMDWWRNTAFPDTEWEQLFTDRSSPCLDVLLDHAPIPKAKKLVGLLHEASPCAIDVLKRKKLPALDASQTRSVQASWRDKVKKGKLTSAQVHAMSSVLWPGEAMSENNLIISQMLSTPWGKDMDPAKRLEFHELPVEKLATQEVISSGPLAGRWNLLTALAFSMIRQHGVAYTAAWWIGDLAKDATPGSLRDACDFQWRDGINANAIALLGAIPQKERYHGQTVSKQQRLEDLFQAMGVSDVDAWIKRYAPDVARFVVEIMARPSKGSCVGISRAILNADAIVKHFTPQERADVFKALARKELCQHAEKDLVISLGHALLGYTGQLDRLGYVELDPSPLRSAIFIRWLAGKVMDPSRAPGRAGKDDDPMDAILSHSDLSVDEIKSVARFVEELGPDADPRWASITEAAMIRSQSTPAGSAARPRSRRL